MSIVTIYEITITAAPMAASCGVGFALEPWGSDTPACCGYDDGGREYALPRDYTVRRSVAGSLAVYDSQGRHCELVRHSSGRPQLVGLGRERPVLCSMESTEARHGGGAG